MWIPVGVWTLLCLIWGTTWLVARIGLRHLPPISFAGLRFLLASALLFAVLGLLRERRSPNGGLLPAAADWPLVIRTGLVAFGATYALMFWGMQYITAGTSAVVFASTPIFTMVLAHRGVGGERLTLARAGGGLLGVAGVALVFADQLRLGDRQALLGCLAVLGSAATLSRAQVDVKAHLGHIGPTELAAWQLLVGGVALTMLGLPVEGNPARFGWTPAAWLALAYLSFIASAAAWFLYYWLLRRVRVTTISTVTLVQPLVAIALGWLVLGETLRWAAAVGATAILAGLSLITKAEW